MIKAAATGPKSSLNCTESSAHPSEPKRSKDPRVRMTTRATAPNVPSVAAATAASADHRSVEGNIAAGRSDRKGKRSE